MSWRRFCNTSWRRLENVLNTSWKDVLKTFWRRMTKTNILIFTKTPWRRLLKTHDWGEYIRLDQDVLKMSSEDEDERRFHQDECLLGSVILFEETVCSRSFILSNVLACFGGSAWAIHFFIQGGFFIGAVAAIHPFRGYMERIIFGSSYLLRTATFLEDLS